jgi:hypothetical protein
MPSNLMGPGTRIERNADDVRRGQSQARMEDANESTRTNTVTVQELQNRRGR